MPPKFKFTREQIIEAAVEITRKNGIGVLTARRLAEELGSSAKPIFGLFQNMEEVKNEVMLSATKIYNEYISDGISSGKYVPYKASGMAYIEFANKEKELFKLLFMRDRSDEHIDDKKDEILPLLEIIEKNLGLSEDEAYRFHIEMWIFVHGIATMAATSYLNWDTQFIDEILSDMYIGLSHRYTGGKNNG